jgi:hypothetical protein
LVFVVAYQNILKLSYIDKLLTEIQLKFRDRYKNVLLAASNGPFDLTGPHFGECDFKMFDDDFNMILKVCEQEARQTQLNNSKPRRFNETDKANRTVSSMVEKKTGVLTNLLSMGTTKTNEVIKPTKKVVTPEETLGPTTSDEPTTTTTNPSSPPSTGPRQMRKFDKNKK